jgi:hypothetical protein
LALTCRGVGEILLVPRSSLCIGGIRIRVHSPFARAKDLFGVGMAKALLGQRVYFNDRLVLESARLRSRVRDLEGVIEHLQHDNDRLRADRPAEVKASAPAY